MRLNSLKRDEADVAAIVGDVTCCLQALQNPSGVTFGYVRQALQDAI